MKDLLYQTVAAFMRGRFSWIIHHVFSMSNVLQGNVKNVKYLPSLHNLTEDLGPFIVRSCPRSFSSETKARLLNTKVNVNKGKHDSSKDPLGAYKAAKRVWRAGGAYTRALCALHIMDYACWRDLPDGIPDPCMKLYEFYHAQKLI